MYGLIALTLLVAAASLVVAISNGLLERKRSFTLLRLSGAPASTLYKVVLLESALPLLVAALISVLIGFGVAATLIKTIAPAGSAIQSPALSYYIIMITSLIAAFLVVCTSLPLLNRMTKPEQARFE